ncbi:hypothetical protein ACLGI4_20730 [Streptomyces sp. HMX112]|uniref:hypothetical protein n=1 Tax=Streptomyces sp. HMX112 TaxID=3390850 RepID=UPI003A807789
MTIKVYRVHPDGTRQEIRPTREVNPDTSTPPPSAPYPKCGCPRCRRVVAR